MVVTYGQTLPRGTSERKEREKTMDTDIRCAWLGNGYVHVRDYRSGLVGLYDPSVDSMRQGDRRGFKDAARWFVKVFDELRRRDAGPGSPEGTAKRPVRVHPAQRPDPDRMMLVKQALPIVGGLSKPSKMPGYGYGLPARECNVGGRLRPIVGSVCHGCYAMKGRYMFPPVQAAQYRRLAALGNPQWVQAMATAIKGQKWFRWHDSGDLQSLSHLAKIVAVAMLTPRTRHWLPTRETAIVKSYRDGGGTFPPNLVVRLSAPMVGARFPERAGPSSMVLAKGQDAPAGVFTCPASHQGGHCGACRACWSPNNVTTAYPIH